MKTFKEDKSFQLKLDKLWKKNMDNKNQTVLEYELPMSELISDFFDNLKSVSSGYASLDWEFLRYQQVKADKLELLLNLEPIDEFSEVVVRV